jgi:peptidyl-prolyl cis-trans isomerase A (cyclophilin A)
MRSALLLSILLATSLAGCAKDQGIDPAVACKANEVADPAGPYTYGTDKLDGVRVRFTTSMGSYDVVTDSEHAPLTVANFLQYVDDGFYACTVYHRMVNKAPGCSGGSTIAVVQGGGQTADGTPKQTRAPIPLESTRQEPNVQWSLAMARSGLPNSATSQFFINVEANSGLNASANGAGKDGYAVFAHVASGQEDIVAMHSVAHSTGTVGKCDWVPATPIVVLSARRG